MVERERGEGGLLVVSVVALGASERVGRSVVGVVFAVFTVVADSLAVSANSKGAVVRLNVKQSAADVHK